MEVAVAARPFLIATPDCASSKLNADNSLISQYYRVTRMGAGMITISKEDYLKAIFEAGTEQPYVISASLAEWLRVSPPAVTMALRRLRRDGLVLVAKDGHIRLTRAGRTIALRTVARHQLIERMLSEIFGMEWFKVHEEAERLEHAVSSEFEAKLREKLGVEQPCPHGNLPVPESPADRRRRGLRSLDLAEPGRRYRVASVYERDRKLLDFLEDRHIRPGAELAVLARHYDETVSARDRSRRLLSGETCEQQGVGRRGRWVFPH